jgi:two-component system chemotaxis response regulator CheV
MDRQKKSKYETIRRSNKMIDDRLNNINKFNAESAEDDDELDLIKLVTTNANDSNQYLIFEASNGELYANNVSKIEELIVYKDLTLAKNTDDSLVIGTANIRNIMTPIMNFDEWFGNEVLPDEQYELVLIAHYGGQRFGMIVKRVEYILTLESENMTDNAQNNSKTTFITNVRLAGKDRLCTIFDSDRMLLDVFDRRTSESQEDIEQAKIKSRSKKMILFADDSLFIRKMVEKLFLKLELDYKIYEDGKQLTEALPLFDPDDIGLFITDIEMPVMGGRQVINIIREDRKYDPIDILVHTNMSNDVMEQSLLDAGAATIIGKVNMLALSEAIAEYMR